MSSKFLLIWLKTVNDLVFEQVQELEDYISIYSFEEENTNITYYSSKQGDKEILLTNDYLLEQTGVNYEKIEEEFKQSQDKQEYIDTIEEPLIKYRLQYEHNAQVIHNEINILDMSDDFSQGDLVGAKVLLTLNPQYHKSPEITQTTQYTKQQGITTHKPVEQVAQYLNLTSQYQDLIEDKQQLYSSLIVKPENIPQSYFENQVRIAEQLGHGKTVITEEYKQELTQILIKDQQTSLDSWLEYLDQEYPTWYQTYVIEGLKKMGSYDKDRNRFSKRRKDYVGTFPELNREALAKVYDYLTKYHNNELNQEEVPKELLDLLKTGSFVRLYEYFLVNMEGVIAWDKEETSGEWIKYEQTNNKKIGEQLAKSLEGYNTGWCTTGISTAQTQLQTGDFYVYYSKNKLGFNSAPRIAIRMENGQVGEVRGIEPSQNLESSMALVMKEKIKDLPGGEEYFIKAEHMELLTLIKQKHDKGIVLNQEELKFLYETEDKIQGFGYQKDPRVEEIKSSRVLYEDLCSLRGITIKKLDLSSQEDLKLLPEGLEIEELNISRSNIIKLPENLKVNKLNMSHTLIKELPKGLKAKLLNMSSTSIRELPDDLKVEELNISNSFINKLPNGFKLKLLRANNSDLTFLPDDLEVELLDITDSKIKTIPGLKNVHVIEAQNSLVEKIKPGLEVENLNLYGSKITKLPRKLKAKSLNIRGTNISELPEDLEVEELDMRETYIDKLPKNLKLKKLIGTSGNLLKGLEIDIEEIDFSNGKVSELPRSLKCKKINVSNTSIKTIPDNLVVEELNISGSKVSFPLPAIQAQYIHASFSNIETIDPNIKVEGLYLNNACIKYLPEGLKLKTLSLINNHYMYELPTNLQVEELFISKTHIEKLPKKLKLKVLTATDSSLTSIPAGTKVEQLHISKTNITRLPKNLGVKELFVDKHILSILKTNSSEEIAKIENVYVV